MRFHVYLAIDHDGEWVAAGTRDYDKPEIIDEWNLAPDYLRARVFRVEIDAPEIPEQAKVIEVIGNYVSELIPD